ncbi:hypothetical protein G3480_25125 [Thiorhodococcus mannitoliphagus]|uniref:Methyl-accepting transducer domain-containing protein n=1 Tax=Thiorhodococcus mannitoliphagus TaxID=329406 RepID=A0A6P1E679_9GAMM|nr:hypothetical protein [Thiorhodococcus mannitoliphagus]NEX23524.1 hypothetical protein [Thiorhodococcus mannitoliphagus]
MSRNACSDRANATRSTSEGGSSPLSAPEPSVESITAASHEQNDRIAQVAQVLTRMDDVTQQNATLVEEAAAAAEGIAEQSSALLRAVSVPRRRQPAWPHRRCLRDKRR